MRISSFYWIVDCVYLPELYTKDFDHMVDGNVIKVIRAQQFYIKNIYSLKESNLYSIQCVKQQYFRKKIEFLIIIE